MNRIRPDRVMLVVLFLTLGLFLSFGTILPRETTALFASPDETAVAQFARGWTMAQGFRLPTGVPEAIADLPGLHPRSMVQQGAWLVPVGFLGMPMLVMPLEQMWEGSGAFFTVLLVISSVWPLWQFARRLSRGAALTASVVYLTFPTVLLYANRGLFPNLPVVALGLWSVWLVGEKERWKVMMGGLLLGLALTIRPIEGMWLVPWVVWGFVHERHIKTIIKTSVTAHVLIAALAFPIIAYVASIQTYQSVVPTIGYWMRDTVESVPLESTEPTEVSIDASTRQVDILPFGIHLRTMQMNIRVFWLEMLWPWVLLAFAGLVQLWWQKKITVKSPVLWLTIWTGAVLFLCYGQAGYLDNIRGTPAIGNSFLRYMLPLVPMMAFAIGAWVHAMARDRRRNIAIAVVVTALAIYGTWMGLARDEEGVVNTQAELRRYVEIRAEAARVLEPGTVVISERSDKIFAGLPGIVAVSPMPDESIMSAMWMRQIPIALFHRQLSLEDAQPFDLLFVNKNEALHRFLSPDAWEQRMEEEDILP